MNIIEKIVSLKEPEIDEFIDKRLSILNTKSTKDDEIDLSYDVVSSFISDQQNVIIDHGGYGFFLNDKSIYKELINAIKENPTALPLMQIFYTIYKYFGEPKPTAEDDLDEFYQSKDEYLQKIMKETGMFEKGKVTLNMLEFKDKGIAVCSQFAPAAHNLSCFLGAESYVLSGRRKYGEKSRGHSHAFNCVKSWNDKYLLIDYLVKTKNPDGTLGVFLAKEISKEEFELFINGDIEITCDNTNPQLIYETNFSKNIFKNR